MTVLPTLLGVSVRNPMRSRRDDLLALVFVFFRFFLVSVPRSNESIAARFADFRGDLAEEFEVIRVASTMAGPSPRAHLRGMAAGPRADGAAGSVHHPVLVL